MNNLGVDALKTTLVDAVLVTEDLIDAGKDGIQVTDALVIFKDLGKIQDVAKNAKQALAEFRDLTPDESEEVVEHVVANTNLSEDGAEGKIKKALRLAARAHRITVEAIDLVDDAKDLFN